MHDEEVFQAIGEAGFRTLVHNFYRCVESDHVLSSLYPAHDMAGAEQRLGDFLIYRFGGPQHYIEQRGHPRLRMRHAPFQVDQQARDHWIACMTAALAGTPAEVAQTLLAYFHSTADAMRNS